MVLAVIALLTGCASAYSKGESAFRQGRFAEAEGYFMKVLAEHPDRLDALVGLGMAQYKRGEPDLAIETLQKALAVRPNDPSVRLYLGLSYLRKNDVARASEQLAALRALPIDPRLAQQVDHTLEVLRRPPLNEQVRDLLVSSLDTAAELAREAYEARLQTQRAFYPPPYFGYPYPGYPYYGFPYFGSGYPGCVLVWRAGQLICI